MDWLARLHPQAARAASAAQPVLAPRFADLSPTNLMGAAATAPDSHPGPPPDSDGATVPPHQPARRHDGLRASAATSAATPTPPATEPDPAASLAPSVQDRAAARLDAARRPASSPEPLSPLRGAPPAVGPQWADRTAPVDRTDTSPPRRGIRPATTDAVVAAARSGVAVAPAPILRPADARRASAPLHQPTRLPGAGDAATPTPLVVQVSIDRIEVRAPATSRPAPPARMAAATSPGISLADYLRGQRSGSRS